jgi:hypothetical protein
VSSGATTPAGTPASITTGTGPDEIVLNISGDALANGDGTSNAAGDAAFTVTVDGKQLGGTFLASASHVAGLDQSFVFDGNFGAGAHSVQVTFDNDAYNPAVGDRNLYVDEVLYSGKDTAQSAAFYWNSTANFSVSAGTATPAPALTPTTASASLATKAVPDATTTNASTPADVTLADATTSTTVGQSNVTLAATGGDHMLFVTGSNDTIKLAGGIETITDTGSSNTYVVALAGAGCETFTNDILLTTGTLDFRTALAATDWDGDISSIGEYLHVVTDTPGAVVSLSPSAGGGAIEVVTINGATSATLSSLLAHAIT